MTNHDKDKLREELRQMSIDEILDKRDGGDYGIYDPTNSRNSDWKVKEANRELTRREQGENLFPQWISIVLSVVALLVAILSLMKQ